MTAPERPAPIDTHVHFWDLQRCAYPWLDGEEWAGIRSDYLPTHFRADTAEVELQAFVHVEAGVDYKADPVAETAWLASLLSSGVQLPPMVCVGYADIRAPDLEGVLARHAEYDFFRGIRKELFFEPEAPEPRAPQTNLVEDDACVAGLRTLAKHDLSFDLLVWPDLLEAACDLFSAVPELPVVIEHLAFPSLDGGAPGPNWRRGLRRFAQEVPQSFLKISGLGEIDAPWTLDSVGPLIQEGLDAFGPGRCMLGSNFPVDRAAAPYSTLWQAYDALTAELSDTERAALYCGTARSAYGIQ